MYFTHFFVPRTRDLKSYHLFVLLCACLVPVHYIGGVPKPGLHRGQGRPHCQAQSAT